MPIPTNDHLRIAPMPAFLYGTAWKEDETRRLVELALEAGFRGIDAANQRRHYHEAQVGEAIAAVLARGVVHREDLFLQTKFTFAEGQDHRLPYDPRADTASQVRQSFQSSLGHLGTTYLDSYVLHGPSRRSGLGPRDREAWAAMEDLVREGQTTLLGVSNVTREQLEELCGEARVLPAFVQNRCYAETGWDAEVRDLCHARGIRYQGFSLLTANPHVVRSATVAAIASRLGVTAPQVVFRFAIQVGMLPLTGTTDVTHMRQDLAAGGFLLHDAEVTAVEGLG